jgi:hypothetical protein
MEVAKFGEQLLNTYGAILTNFQIWGYNKGQFGVLKVLSALNQVRFQKRIFHNKISLEKILFSIYWAMIMCKHI